MQHYLGEHDDCPVDVPHDHPGGTQHTPGPSVTAKKEDFEIVGHVGVDAGCLMIVDPCYTTDATSDHW